MFIFVAAFRGLPWSYHGCPDEAGKSAADSTGTAGKTDTFCLCYGLGDTRRYILP